MKQRKQYERPAVARVRLEDKEIVTMATGCKTAPPSTTGFNSALLDACVNASVTSCFNQGS